MARKMTRISEAAARLAHTFDNNCKAIHKIRETHDQLFGSRVAELGREPATMPGTDDVPTPQGDLNVLEEVDRRLSTQSAELHVAINELIEALGVSTESNAEAQAVGLGAGLGGAAR